MRLTNARTCLSTQLVSHDNPNQAHNELYNFEEAVTKQTHCLSINNIDTASAMIKHMSPCVSYATERKSNAII